MQAVTEPVVTLHDVNEINRFLRGHQDRPVKIWRYHISHSCLELEMMHEGEIRWEKSTAKFTTIFCHMTRSLMVPEIAWRARLVASESKGEDGSSIISLVDEAVGFRVECEHLFLYVGRGPAI